MSKCIFISDLHMNDERSVNPSHHYGWLPVNRAQEVADFLNYINGFDDVDELVLLGDTLDTWVCPIDVIPQTFDDILTASHNQCIIDAFNKIIARGRIKLTYVVGNHDMLITKDILSNYIPGINFIGNDKYQGTFTDDKVLAEHGHLYATFNAPDFENSKYKGLPLGYFISRIAATNGSEIDMHKLFKDTKDTTLASKLPETVIDIVLHKSKLKETDSIILPDGTKALIKDIKAEYANLCVQWETEDKPVSLIDGLLAEVGLLGISAKSLFGEDTNIVLFGHTHDKELKEFHIDNNNYLYANTGTWCEKKLANDNKPQSYVEIKKDEMNQSIIVQLVNWENNAPVLVKSKSLSL